MEVQEGFGIDEISTKKKVAFNVLTLLISLIVLGSGLGAIEFALRLTGIGSDRSPLVEKQVLGYTFYVPNKAFYQQFFDIPLSDFVNWDHLDFRVPKNKEPGTIRIFTFGESALYGLESSIRQMELMLRHAKPDIQWEVFNVSCPGINSHVLYGLAKACAKFQPDVFVIYMGNNETIGPFGEHSLFYHFPWFRRNVFIRFYTWMKGLRIVQLFESSPQKDWRDRKPVQYDSFIPKQSQEKITMNLFERNMSDMVRIGIEAGANVIVGTLSFNRQFGKSETELKSIQYETTPMNERIKIIVSAIKTERKLKDNKVFLVDVDKILSERSPDGIPGYMYFCDNIHFTFDGNYIVATEWYKAIMSSLGLEKEMIEGNVLSKDVCKRYLGWTDAMELKILQFQKKIIQDPISLRVLHDKEEKLQSIVTNRLEEEVLRGYEVAYQLFSEDEKVTLQYIDALFNVGKYDEAFEIAKKWHERVPYSRLAMRMYANALAHKKDFDEALRMYEQCIFFYPDDELARMSYSTLRKNRGQ